VDTNSLTSQLSLQPFATLYRAQELLAKATWLNRHGLETQVHTSGSALLYGCCMFALSCTIAWGVMGTVFCIGAIMNVVTGMVDA
jgi:hypothetical protein